MHFEAKLAALLRQYLIVALPLAVLLIRLLVNFFARDIKGMLRRILSIPEDLVVIAFTLVLSGMAGANTAFISFYQKQSSSPYISGGLLAIALFLLAVLLHIWNAKFVEVKFQAAYVARREFGELSREAEEKKIELPKKAAWYILSYVLDFVFGAIYWLAALAISVVFLGFVLQVILP